VNPNTAGQTPDNVIGYVHNHPGGGLTPSGSDWANFDALFNWVEQYSAGGFARASMLRQYIIARDTTDPNSEMMIRVYNNSSSRQGEATGPEVNPNGLPCP